MTSESPKAAESEARLKQAESEYGLDDPRLIPLLQSCAAIFRQEKIRLLDAANLEAKARLLNAKQNTRVTEEPSVPQSGPNWGDESTRCPYCAETIKKAAIKCRFCGSDLNGTSASPAEPKPSSAQRDIDFSQLGPYLTRLRATVNHRWKLIGSVTLVCFCTIALLPVLISSVAPKGSVFGGMFIVWQRSGSEILRGQQVVLCKQRFKSEFDSDNVLRELSGEKYAYSAMADDQFRQAMQRFKELMSQEAVSESITDVEGKYRLKDVPGGDYYLVSIFCHGSSYDRKECVFWIVPVSVSNGETQCDLSNNNMASTFKYREY
jgi:hypothetical protein